MTQSSKDLYDAMEIALTRAQSMMRAGFSAERAGAQLLEGFGETLTNHMRQVFASTDELATTWPSARDYKRELLSAGSDPRDIADLATDLFDTIKTQRGLAGHLDLLPRQRHDARGTNRVLESMMPGVVATILLARRGLRPRDIVAAKERPESSNARARIGETLAERLHLNRPSPLARATLRLMAFLRPATDRRVDTVIDDVRSGTLDASSRRLIEDGRKRSWAHEAPAAFDVLQWVEGHLPGTTGALSLTALIDKYESHRTMREAIQRITADEHRYARGLGLDATLAPLSRRSLGDVAAAAAYHRVVAHGDPFAIFDETVAKAGPAHARTVATAVEVAAVDRLNRLLLEPAVKGGPPTVAVGTCLDDRVRDALLAAWTTGTLREEVERHVRRLGENDPEACRIENVAARMFEADLLLHAIAELRPVAANLRAEPSHRWGEREVAAMVFAEDDPRDPPRTSDGEILTWQAMLARHPAVGTPFAATELSTIAPALMATDPVSV